MSEIVVVAVLTAAPGREADAEALIADVVATTHEEDGCIVFAPHRDTNDPTAFVIVERWASRAALDAHIASEHLAAFRAAFAEVAGAPAQVRVLEARPAGDPVKGNLGG